MPKGKGDIQDAIISRYLQDCSRLLRTGFATDEQTFYPAINNLLKEAGALTVPKRTPIPHPTSVDQNHPDLALYEESTQVLAMPIEVKPLAKNKKELLALPQAIRYAKTYGGGHVFVSNIWQIIWAELNSEDELEERDSVDLIDDPAKLSLKAPQPKPGSALRLANFINAACSVRSTISEPERLATLLAYHATRMAEAVNGAGDPEKLLRPLSQTMQEGLGMQLKEELFVPTVVQTLVYAIFAAWLDADNPSSFDYRETQDLLGVEVIAELFHYILDPKFARRCNLRSHLEACVRVLHWVDRSAFLSRFDDAAIEYFYEPFLAKFDPHLRDKLGVWYTPREIAEYQAQRVHHELISQLAIPDGLASNSVLTLDPASGTGTYLVAILRHIYKFHLANNEPPQSAAAKTRRAAVERVFGFEILPAALIISHLHVARYLKRIGVPLGKRHRLPIYLTNSLMGWGGTKGDKEIPMPLPGIEEELKRSLKIKLEDSVIAVIGNPPYHGFSAAERAEEKALLRDWIDPLWKEYGVRKHRLGDLYIRFWRVAVKKIAELERRGVISFITNRKWLGGRSFPAMRRHIVNEFQEITVDDLHGDVHDSSSPNDQSIFTTDVASGIQRGVAIVTAVRSQEETKKALARVRRRDFRGAALEKRKKLLHLAETNINAQLKKVPVSRESGFKFVRDSGADAPGLDEYFTKVFSGIQPVRDEAVMEFSPEPLRARMTAYFNPKIKVQSLLAKYPEFGVEREGYNPQSVRRILLQNAEFEDDRITRFMYKPMDARWLYWEHRSGLLHRPRTELMPYAACPGQAFIVAAQTPRRPQAARPAFSSGIAGFHSVDPDARLLARLGTSVIPTRDSRQQGLEFGEPAESGTHSNIRPECITAARSIGYSGSDIKVGDAIFYALLTAMHAPSFVASVGVDNDDFAAIPVPGTLAQLKAAEKQGRKIAALLDPLSEIKGITTGHLQKELSSIAIADMSERRGVTAGTRTHGGVWTEDQNGSILWNTTDGWRSVPKLVWEYSVGGFQILSKWLGYRHEKAGYEGLSDVDIETVTHICRRITTLLELQKGCEDLYAAAIEHPLEF